MRGVTAGDFDNDGWPDLYISMLDQRRVYCARLELNIRVFGAALLIGALAWLRVDASRGKGK